MHRLSIPFGLQHGPSRWFLQALHRHRDRVPEAVRGLPASVGIPPVCGAVALSDMAAVHAAGFGDAEIVEAIARDRRAGVIVPVSGR